MITDVILSSIVNLFALLGAKHNADADKSRGVLTEYLTRHFGIRNYQQYTDLYGDLRDLYDMTIDIDKDEVVENICVNLQSHILADEQELTLLRLMEFCYATAEEFDSHSPIFKKIAETFKVSAELYIDFCNFVEGRPTEHVKIEQYAGFEGQLKTLYISTQKRLIFSYQGDEEVLVDGIPVLKGHFQTWSKNEVLRNHEGSAIYYSTIMDPILGGSKHDEVLFSGRKVNFRYPNSDNGLHDFSFDLRSGEFVAIMGGSGSGKTTLLYVLNGNFKASSGSITINGHDISEKAAKDLIGFVPQEDLLIEELTVYQNLWYTAKLCFEGMSDEELDRRVMKTLTDLGLDVAKDLKVGSPIEKYISGGQRKRLNIALELIREPAVLFLDEPTSGLSSTDTEKLILLLKEQTAKGKLIACNIHQPSSDVYKLFDRLWIMDVGGYPVFDGNPIEAITYFKTVANYADADTSICPTCGNANPEIVLNIVAERRLDESGRLSSERKMTPQQWHDLYLGKVEGMDDVKQTAIPKTDQVKPNALKQLWIFLQRNVMSKVTNVQYLLITLLEAPLLAFICGMLTHYAPQSGYTLMDNKNFISYLFMAIIVATFIGMSGSAEEIIKDRALLKREKFLQLSYPSYIFSKVVFLAFASLVQTFLFILVGNLIMEVPWSLFDVWWGVMFTTTMLASLTGLLLSQCLSSVVAIYISIPLLLIPQILLCGVVVDFRDLTPNSTTGNVPAIGNVIPSRWAYEALAVSSFKDNDYEKSLFDVACKKNSDLYYHRAFLYTLQSELETMEDERQKGAEVNPSHLAVIKNELPTITEVSGIAPYTGSYDYASLRAYMDEAKQAILKRSNRNTLDEDIELRKLQRRYGKENLVQLKRENYNLKLADMVTGANSEVLCEVVDGSIVPRMGFIYTQPRTHCGNAPFYSSVKMLGNKAIPTLHFNLAIEWLMSLVCIILLVFDWPGRKLRK